MTMDIKVPFRRPIEIDEMVADLLGKYGKWKGAPPRPPMPVDDIAEGYFKLDFAFDDLEALLEEPGVLGATWLEEKVMRVDCSLESNPRRVSFTIAHEIGHWWMHRPILEMEKVTLPLFAYEKGRRATPVVICRSGRKDPAEWQADQFAARLLMPAAAVREAARRICPGLPKKVATLRVTESSSDLRAMADEVIQAGGFSNVSNEAMCYRLIDLKVVVDANAAQGLLL